MIVVICDNLTRKAYGDILILSGSCSNTPWHQQLKSIVYHSGNHYVLPGGRTGRRFDLLMEEIQHLAVGNFPSPVTSIMKKSLQHPVHSSWVDANV